MNSLRSVLAFSTKLLPLFVISFLVTGGAVAAPWVPNGIPVGPEAGTQTTPVIVPDGSGGAYIVWEDARTNPRRTFAQHLTAVGDAAAGWPTSGLALPTDGVERSRPYAIPDGSGGVIVVDDGGPFNMSPLIVSHLNFDGAMAAGWPIDGVRITGYPDGPGTPGTACCRNWVPVAALGGSGRLFTSWTYSNRFYDAGRVGARVEDGATAPDWTPNGTYLNGSFVQQWGPIVGAVGNQDAFVVSPGFGDLVRKAQASGGLSPEAYQPTGGGFRDAPGIVEDGAGGAFVFWTDAGFTPPRLMAQHLLSDLSVATGWPANGLDVCAFATESGTHVQFPGTSTTLSRSSVATDGHGGAFIVWTDLRAGAGAADIYAQHLLGDGSLAWPVNGLRLCGATGDQRLARVADDGDGGVVVAWQDHRNGVDEDVYALRVTGSGAIANGWPMDGLFVSSAAGDQSSPVVATDDAGNAIVAWVDARSEPTQIYATRIVADGVLGIPDQAVDAGFAIARVVPNPSSEGFAVTFTLPAPGRAEIELIDLTGRIVARRTVETTGAGPHVQRFDRRAVTRSGVYWLRLSRDGVAVSRRICVVR